MATANDLRKGNTIRYQGDVYLVLEAIHRTPGNLRAFVQANLRNLRTGSSTQVRFSSTETVEIVPVAKRKLEYSYQNSSGYIFLDPETFDQITLVEELVRPYRNYLVSGGNYDVVFTDDGSPLQVELPASVNLRVVEAPQGVKGDSATNVRKPVRLETGLELNVPLFISEGEVLKVDTRTGEYIGRA